MIYSIANESFALINYISLLKPQPVTVSFQPGLMLSKSNYSTRASFGSIVTNVDNIETWGGGH